VVFIIDQKTFFCSSNWVLIIQVRNTNPGDHNSLSPFIVEISIKVALLESPFLFLLEQRNLKGNEEKIMDKSSLFIVFGM
jgi:hypothetical protein